MSVALSSEGEEVRTGPTIPCIEASQLIQRIADRAFHDVRCLANILGRVNLDSRREDLLDYVRLNRARFLKAYAVIKWLAGRQGELVLNASNALAAAKNQRELIDTVRYNFGPVLMAVRSTCVPSGEL